LPPLDDLTLQEDQDLGNPIITFPGPDDDIYRYIDPEKDPNYPQTYQGCRAFYGGDFALPNPGVLPPECYKGQMGVSYYEVQTNILTITKAQQVLDNGQKDVAEREQSCHDLESHNAQLNAITDHYN